MTETRVRVMDFENREEIEVDIRRIDEIAELFRAQYPSKLKEKLSDGAD